MADGAGRFFAVGTTSPERGCQFGAPVAGPGVPPGLAVFKIDLDAIEGSWRGGDHEIVVTDPEGIVLLSCREDWQFRALGPIDGGRLPAPSVVPPPPRGRGGAGPHAAFSEPNPGRIMMQIKTLAVLAATTAFAVPALAQELDRTGWPSSLTVGTARQGGTFFVTGSAGRTSWPRSSASPAPVRRPADRCRTWRSCTPAIPPSG
jgi:hypothetical protein